MTVCDVEVKFFSIKYEIPERQVEPDEEKIMQVILVKPFFTCSCVKNKGENNLEQTEKMDNQVVIFYSLPPWASVINIFFDTVMTSALLCVYRCGLLMLVWRIVHHLTCCGRARLHGA